MFSTRTKTFWCLHCKCIRITLFWKRASFSTKRSTVTLVNLFRKYRINYLSTFWLNPNRTFSPFWARQLRSLLSVHTGQQLLFGQCQWALQVWDDNGGAWREGDGPLCATFTQRSDQWEADRCRDHPQGGHWQTDSRNAHWRLSLHALWILNERANGG